MGVAVSIFISFRKVMLVVLLSKVFVRQKPPHER
jgi:hypothetical protein